MKHSAHVAKLGCGGLQHVQGYVVFLHRNEQENDSDRLFCDVHLVARCMQQSTRSPGLQLPTMVGKPFHE